MLRWFQLHRFHRSIIVTRNLNFLRLQSPLKRLPGDADHVADEDRLEHSGVDGFIGRGTADTENGCDITHGVCPAFGRTFFVGTPKMLLPY